MKRSRESELGQRREMIAHLKDQLQEMKAKTAMENKYVKKVCDVSIAQTQKRCAMTEKALQNEIAVIADQQHSHGPYACPSLSEVIKLMKRKERPLDQWSWPGRTQGRRSPWDRGTRPPNIWTGGHDHECPPNISRVISGTFYPCNIFLIS